MAERNQITMSTGFSGIHEALQELQSVEAKLEFIKQKARQIDQTTTQTFQKTALAVQDATMLLNMVQTATGIQLNATLQAALDIITMGAFAARQVAALYATNPALAPFAAGLAIAAIMLEIQSISDVRQQHAEAQARITATQTLINIGVRYT